MSDFSEAWVNLIPPPKKDYRARAGNKRAFGDTAGEAWDTLVRQLSENEDDTLVVIEYGVHVGDGWYPSEDNPHIIVKRNKPDRYFTQQQRERLSALMEKLNAAREGGVKPTPAEMRELEELVEAELQGAMERAKANFGGLPA